MHVVVQHGAGAVCVEGELAERLALHGEVGEREPRMQVGLLLGAVDAGVEGEYAVGVWVEAGNGIEL